MQEALGLQDSPVETSCDTGAAKPGIARKGRMAGRTLTRPTLE